MTEEASGSLLCFHSLCLWTKQGGLAWLLECSVDKLRSAHFVPNGILVKKPGATGAMTQSLEEELGLVLGGAL